jgi:hypothetical protein
LAFENSGTVFDQLFSNSLSTVSFVLVSKKLIKIASKQSSVFVERSSTKERYRQPPSPNLETIVSPLPALAARHHNLRARKTAQFNYLFFTILQLILYNFTILQL